MKKIVLEKIQKFAANKKMVITSILLPIIIILSLTVYQANRYLKLSFGYERLNNLEHLASSSLEKRTRVRDFLESKIDSDSYFIDNNLENLKFLKNEINTYKKLKSHIAFAQNEEIKKRYDFLTNKNKLKFFEENIKTSSLVKETEERQINSIEVNEEDVEKLLSIIEEKSIKDFKPTQKMPQLIITNFNLKKEKSDSFLLDMKLLKREFGKKKNHE